MSLTIREISDILIAHTRLDVEGQCSCGVKGRLGDRFPDHQAEKIRQAQVAAETERLLPEMDSLANYAFASFVDPLHDRWQAEQAVDAESREREMRRHVLETVVQANLDDVPTIVNRTITEVLSTSPSYGGPA